MGADPPNEHFSEDGIPVFVCSREGDIGDDPPFVAPDIKAHLLPSQVIGRRKGLLHVNKSLPGTTLQDVCLPLHRVLGGAIALVVSSKGLPGQQTHRHET